jgi:hypothetical protein
VSLKWGQQRPRIGFEGRKTWKEKGSPAGPLSPSRRDSGAVVRNRAMKAAGGCEARDARPLARRGPLEGFWRRSTQCPDGLASARAEATALLLRGQAQGPRSSPAVDRRSRFEKLGVNATGPPFRQGPRPAAPGAIRPQDPALDLRTVPLRPRRRGEGSLLQASRGRRLKKAQPAPPVAKAS